MTKGHIRSTRVTGTVLSLVWVVGVIMVFVVAGVLGMLPIRGAVLTAALAYVTAVGLIHAWDVIRGASIISPHHFVFAVWELFVAGGMVSYAVREAVWFNYYGDIWRAIWACVVATLGLWLGYAAASRDRRLGSLELVPSTQRERERLLSAAAVLMLVGWMGAGLMYIQTGVLPVFAANVDAARVLVNRTGSGLLLPMLMCSALAIGLCAATAVGRSIPRSHRYSALLISVAALPPLVVYGGRFLIVFPLLLGALIWIWSGTSTVRAALLPLFGTGTVALSMRLVVLRIYGESATAAQAFRGVLNDLFPEVRSFAIALHTVSREGLWRNIVGPVGTGLLPGGVATLLGIDKQALFVPIGGVVLSSMSQFYGNQILGIRVGIVGEFYLAFGLGGVIFLGVATGVCACLADRIWRRATAGAFALAAVLTAALASLMPYGSVFIITCVTLTVPTWVTVSWASHVGVQGSARSSGCDRTELR